MASYAPKTYAVLNDYSIAVDNASMSELKINRQREHERNYAIPGGII